MHSTSIKIKTVKKTEVTPLAIVIASSLSSICIPIYFSEFSNSTIKKIRDLTDSSSDLTICIGFGLLADLAGLSSALGSFIAGLLVGKLKVFNWLEHSLASFKVFFVALFIVSIGLRLDLKYFLDHKDTVLTGTLFVLVSNSLMSAIILRLLNYDWKNSWYGGALLSQTGEFGILGLNIAYKTGIIHYDLYKSGLGITCLTLLFSTIWIAVLKKVVNRNIVKLSKSD